MRRYWQRRKRFAQCLGAVDTRRVSAWHGPLSERAFHADLYYRLQVFDIRIPPLRDRSSDIPLLTDVFLEELGRSLRCAVAGVSAEAMALLMTYRWPGNVRELHNVLERAAILGDGGPSRRITCRCSPS